VAKIELFRNMTFYTSNERKSFAEDVGAVQN